MGRRIGQDSEQEGLREEQEGPMHGLVFLREAMAEAMDAERGRWQEESNQNFRENGLWTSDA